MPTGSDVRATTLADGAYEGTARWDTDAAQPLMEAEMARIALRRSFEDMAATENGVATTGAAPLMAGRGRPPSSRVESSLRLLADGGQGCPVGSGGVPRLFRQGVW